MGILPRLLLLSVVLWLSLSAHAENSPAPPTVAMTCEIHTLRIEREDPQVSRAVAV